MTFRRFLVDSFLDGKRVKQVNMLNTHAGKFDGVALDELSIQITILGTSDINRLKQFIQHIEPCFIVPEFQRKNVDLYGVKGEVNITPTGVYCDPHHRWYSDEEIKAKFKEFREHPERWDPTLKHMSYDENQYNKGVEEAYKVQQTIEANIFGKEGIPPNLIPQRDKPFIPMSQHLREDPLKFKPVDWSEKPVIPEGTIMIGYLEYRNGKWVPYPELGKL